MLNLNVLGETKYLTNMQIQNAGSAKIKARGGQCVFIAWFIVSNNE